MEKGSFFSLWVLRCVVVDDGDGEDWSAIGTIRRFRYVYMLFDSVCRGMKRAIRVVCISIMKKQIIELRAE